MLASDGDEFTLTLLPLIAFRAGALHAAVLPRITYALVKHEVKEEHITLGNEAQRRHHDPRAHATTTTSGSSGGLRRSMPEVKEEDDDEEAEKAVRCRRSSTSSHDPIDIPRYNAAFMSSLNDDDSWRGNIDNVIASFIHESGRPVVNLTRDDSEACLGGAVKDETTDPPCKQYVIEKDD